ncbi:MAG: aquaporin [Roseovarius sp.]
MSTTSADERPTGDPQSRTARARALAANAAGESFGTFILVFFGVGSVMAAVATGAQAGLWQVAVVWAIGVSLAIYATAALSGAHINPAITLVAVVYDRMPLLQAGVYVLSQLLGAMLAALVLYAMFAGTIEEFEHAHGLLRGGAGSELSAMMFGEYFPNPAVFGTDETAWRVVSIERAFIAEAVGTAVLAFMVGALTSERNMARPPAGSTAVIIGITVAAIISIVAPLTQAALNPARDLGPRIVAYFLGWGEVAIPGPRNGWLTVYVLAPFLGGIVGGGLQRLLARLAPG